MIYIISGPTCAGKSTLLQSTRIHSITNLSPTYPVVFPGSIPSNADILQNGCYFHYNLLRAANKAFKSPDNINESMHNFKSDYPWSYMHKLSIPKKAIILIASRTVIEKRITSRRHIEPSNLTGRSPSPYPVSHWMKVLNTVDLQELYLAWCAELKQIGITYTLINAENGDYETLRQEQLKYLRLNM